MALIDITPVMTSNNTPSPYVVTASNHSNEPLRYPYNAFDGTTNATTAWKTSNGSTNGWIMLDYSSIKKIHAYSIQAAGNTTVSPKDFILYGSNDKTLFTAIDIQSSIVLWDIEETRLFVLKEPVSYRYYKLVISSNNDGADILVIRKIKFFQDDEEIENISNKKAPLNYCLPKNSTLAMTQRQNDPREGLLGFANDPDDRYGTLYIVDDKGKAIIPKSKIVDADILFDGLANTEGSIINLPVSINKYREVIIEWSADINTEYKYKKYHSYFTKDIVYSKTIISVAMNHASGQYAFGNVNFNDEFTIKLNNLYRGYFTHSGITKIYGIK